MSISYPPEMLPSAGEDGADVIVAGVWQLSDAMPAINVQVVGIEPGKHAGVAWWTRTHDGWYVSQAQGTLGNRDASRVENSRGPAFWTHAPLWLSN